MDKQQLIEELENTKRSIAEHEMAFKQLMEENRELWIKEIKSGFRIIFIGAAVHAMTTTLLILSILRGRYVYSIFSTLVLGFLSYQLISLTKVTLKYKKRYVDGK